MFKVAICDDQEVLCTQLETVILEKCQTWNLPVEIEIFSSGEFLCNYLYAGKQFDLIFLDIHLQQLRGNLLLRLSSSSTKRTILIPINIRRGSHLCLCV